MSALTGTQLPATVTYGTITGQLVTAVLDGPDTDSNPDMRPVRGSITFTLLPNGDYLKETAAQLIIIPQPITVNLDDNGYFSVTLISTDSPGLNTSAKYLIEFNLIGSKAGSVQISLPGGNTIDLSSVL